MMEVSTHEITILNVFSQITKKRAGELSKVEGHKSTIIAGDFNTLL
jgi:hypothetical protein